ncbi:MAG: helix-turn-helix domain-containing protein [Butyrivibrio sp.]
MEHMKTTGNYELIPLDDKTNVRFFTSEEHGSFSAPHWHDAIEIILLQKGTLSVSIDTSTCILHENECILIPPDRIHSALCTGFNRSIVLQIPEPFLEKYIPNADTLEFCLKDPADNPVTQSKVDFIKDTLKKMQYTIDERPDGYMLKFNSLLFEVMFRLYHNFSIAATPSEFYRRNKNLERLKPVLHYIADNYNRPISLAQIAEIAMFEPKYFCRFFKKCMGMTFLEYQNEIRLSRIYKDILTTDNTVSDILETHGFTNYKLFRKMFKAHFNTTPGQLRRSL